MADETTKAPISCGKLQHRTVEDFVVLWLDSNISENNTNYHKFITQPQQIVTSTVLFTEPDQCVDLLTDIVSKKAFMIVSNNLAYQVVPLIQDLSQLHSIYIFGGHNSKHEQCFNDFYKVRGIFDQIQDVYEAFKRDLRQSNSSLMPISIMNSFSSTNLNELDQSFMYTQLLKDILLKMEHDSRALKELAEYCRSLYQGRQQTLQIVQEFEQRYPDPSSIWWYTRECFLYWMLNKALRTQDVATIIKMGFFARDLHEQIEQLYLESHNRHCFIVYRGQGMLNDEFVKMSRSKGGLLSFNNFLSTTTDQVIAQAFAESATENPDLTGILFQMEINPFISSTPFASLNNISYCKDTENEILFSMHTIFRIGEMKQIGDRLWEVHLRLTSDKDEQLTRLTDYIRERTDASTELHRLGSLMFVMGEFNKAEEIFEQLLEATSKDDWNGAASLHHMLGYVNHEKGNLVTALVHYQQSLDIDSRYLPSDDPKLCRNYSGIGLVLKEQNNLDEALKHFRRSLDIDLRGSHQKQLNIATHYNNIGGVLDEQGKYVEALKNYEQTLEIELVHLPPNHPSLAITYSNIAGVYDALEDNLTALFYYEKALEIQKKSLPSNHPWLATTYNNIADVYDCLDNSLTALIYYKKALEVQEKCSLSDPSSLATIHSNIAMTLDDLDRNEEAVEHISKALHIVYHTFGPDHPDVTEYRKNLDQLRQKL